MYGISFVEEQNEANIDSVVSQGHGDVVRLLLAEGANPNVATVAGETPLFIAEHLNRRVAVQLLIPVRETL